MTSGEEGKEHHMFGFWQKRLTTLPLKQASAASAVRRAPAVKTETFLARAKRNDTDGSRRRLRQIVDENRLL